MTRLIIGPFNRIEGDLEVRLEVHEGLVRSAQVVSPLFRGFETMLTGKTPSDALIFVPRICGICSVSQSVASARAIGAAQGLAFSGNGALSVNIVHAIENIADHLTHFYLFFMPDFTRPAYSGRVWYEDIVQRFAAVKGTAASDVLPARAQFLQMMGILAGKWPHTLSIRPGGSTRAVSSAERARLAALLAGFRRFLERNLYGDRLESVVALSSASALDSWVHRRATANSDFGQFLAVSADLKLHALGRAHGRFLSVGAYASDRGHLFAPGTLDGSPSVFDPSKVTEDTDHSWYHIDHGRRAPFDGQTLPVYDELVGYSWCKAPRYDGKPYEVGALARQIVNGQPLLADLVQRDGGSVHSRVVARLVELAATVLALESWVALLEPEAPFCVPDCDPRRGDGIGLTEAARGSLGHWLSVRDGRIANYQIIAPTTWNFSPRDNDGVPGPLEQALAGVAVDGPESVNVQHIVRSFDPCMVCTVH
ncbi:nickel-dependent hydrogenase large subunit [Rhizobium aegyptiacum]|uniref:nickel-dependent hydrogenase large subunit n=1 Tax=Rhizobium aegyptiacum TaxID=1764550 RepID=UPI0007E5A860|nr:nickel-dependent hydrogenase large subunit [Rhizobium aegyptiacum]